MIIKAEAIKRHADYQKCWHAYVQVLRKGRFLLEDPIAISIHGDAPKSFLRIREYIPGHSNRKPRRWQAYIAKVGSKRYPVESFTEHLLTRIGQAFDVVIADSRLMVMGGQVRFLSKYFLRQGRESLVHGLEIFRRYLDDTFVAEVAEKKQEQDFYTFQTVLAAISEIYEPYAPVIMSGLVEMLAFDAIAGNNDRHPLNWGVVVPMAIQKPVVFAPIFDSARGLFWNLDDYQLAKFTHNAPSMDAYVKKSRPQIGFDGMENINHFDLVGAIYQNFPEYRPNLDKLSREECLAQCDIIIEDEFKDLMSSERRHAIRTCLARRFTMFCDSLR